MKTRKEQASEMLESLKSDLLKQEIVHDYREYIFKDDKDLKGNLEAQKELNASKSQIDRTKKMIDWLSTVCEL